MATHKKLADFLGSGDVRGGGEQGQLILNERTEISSNQCHDNDNIPWSMRRCSNKIKILEKYLASASRDGPLE
jgi:hypothetical protein